MRLGVGDACAFPWSRRMRLSTSGRSFFCIYNQLLRRNTETPMYLHIYCSYVRATKSDGGLLELNVQYDKKQRSGCLARATAFTGVK